LTKVVPSVVVPSLNVTVPVAVVEDNIALNVVTAPYEDGFADEAKVTVVAALFTNCVNTVEPLLI
jgi:hypothetical protein